VLEVDEAGDLRATEEDVVQVLDRQAIQPSPNPSQERAAMHLHLQSQQWSQVYYAVESFRRLCIHHPSQVLDESLNCILPLLCKSAKALRSAVARNGLLALRDLFLCTTTNTTTNTPLAFCSEELLHLLVFAKS
jgi:hypothetical protein